MSQTSLDFVLSSLDNFINKKSLVSRINFVYSTAGAFVYLEPNAKTKNDVMSWVHKNKISNPIKKEFLHCSLINTPRQEPTKTVDVGYTVEPSQYKLKLFNVNRGKAVRKYLVFTFDSDLIKNRKLKLMERLK